MESLLKTSMYLIFKEYAEFISEQRVKIYAFFRRWTAIESETLLSFNKFSSGKYPTVYCSTFFIKSFVLLSQEDGRIAFANT